MRRHSTKHDDSMIGLCLWALRYAFRRWPGLLAVLTTMLLKIGLDVLRPWPMKVLVDNVLNGEPMTPGLAQGVGLLPGPATPENLLAWCVAGTVVLFLLGWAAGLAASWASVGFGQRLVYDLGADLFGHLQRLSLLYHSRRSVGDLIRRVTADCGCVSTIVKDALLPVLTALVSLVVMFAVMWRMDPTLTLLSLAVIPFMIAVFRRYAVPMLERSYEQHEAEGRMYDVVEQTLSAVPVVQAFAQEERATRRFRESTDGVLRAALAVTNVQLKFKVLMGLATAAGTAAILWVGSHHVLEGRLTVGGILVFLSYLASLYGPLEALMYTSSTIQGAAGSARRVHEVLEAVPEVSDRPGALTLRSARGHVRLEEVTFGYEPGRPVLQQVSLELHPGHIVALVGVSGAGKSTLAALLGRLFDPWQGRLTLDGIDFRDLRLASLRAQVALVLQEPFLFPVSIAENIAYGKPGASRAEVEAAARAAGAHEFIVRLPGGYEAVVGERGATLSGGERQRLAVARALVRGSAVLVLDEPSSALDAVAEAGLLGGVAVWGRERAVLLIAHRLSAVRWADRIVVLQEGRVAEVGTHHDLLARNGLYARLYNLQFGQPAMVSREGQS